MDDTQKMLCALSYVLWPVAVVLLIIEETKMQKQQDKLARHHAYNALGFAIAALLVSIPVFILMWLPILGYVVSTLYWITVVVLAIVYAIRAYQGQQVIIPLVTEFLNKNVKDF
jgi:uncharacterized membrane protein